MQIKIGEKFGEWLFIGGIKFLKQDKKIRCKCSCGKTSYIYLKNLTRGLSKSCGKHGKYWQRKYHEFAKKIPEWNIWSGMKNRCFNKNNTAYKNYGGRGITVNKNWLGENGFKNFYKDMGKRPDRTFTLERVNNNGNYSPKNCKWIPRSEQSKNRRKRKKISYNPKIRS